MEWAKRRRSILLPGGWQVTLCDPIWHVSSRSGDGRLACKLLYAHFTFTLPTDMLKSENNGTHLWVLILTHRVSDRSLDRICRRKSA